MPKTKPCLRKACFVILVLFLCFTPASLFAATPTVGTITPSSGSTAPNTAKAFTCTYSDTDGWTNLKETHLLISASTTTLSNSVYAYYDQNSNLVYLRDDTNTAWLGGFNPGSANTIENSQARKRIIV